MAEGLALAFFHRVSKVAVKREQKRRQLLRERPLYHRRSAPSGDRRSGSSERRRHLSASSVDEFERLPICATMSTSPSLELEGSVSSPRNSRRMTLLLHNSGSPQSDETSDDDDEDFRPDAPLATSNSSTSNEATLPVRGQKANGIVNALYDGRQLLRNDPHGRVDKIRVSLMVPDTIDPSSQATVEININPAEHFITAEDVAIYCGRKANIPSRWFPLFGLYSADKELWLPTDFNDFTRLREYQTDEFVDLDFRFRNGVGIPDCPSAAPHTHPVKDQTQNPPQAVVWRLPDVIVEYLFYQLKRDFVSGRITGSLDREDDLHGESSTLCDIAASAKSRNGGKKNSLSDSNETGSPPSPLHYKIRCLSLAAYSLYHEKPEDMEHSEFVNRLKGKDIDNHLPQFTFLDVIKWKMMGPKSKSLIRSGFQKIWKSKLTRRHIELEYVSRVISLCSPFEERFSVGGDVDEDERDVIVTVRPGVDAPIPVVVLPNGSEMTVTDILRLEIIDSRVRLCKNPRDEDLTFISPVFAQSFASLVNLYAMLSRPPEKSIQLCLSGCPSSSLFYSSLEKVCCQVSLPAEARKRIFIEAGKDEKSFLLAEDKARVAKLLLYAIKRQSQDSSEGRIEVEAEIEYNPETGMWFAKTSGVPKDHVETHRHLEVVVEKLSKLFGKDINVGSRREVNPSALLYSSASSSMIKREPKLFRASEIDGGGQTSEIGGIETYKKEIGREMQVVVKRITDGDAHFDAGSRMKIQSIVDWSKWSDRPESLLFAFGSCLDPLSVVLEPSALNPPLTEWLQGRISQDDSSSQSLFAVSFAAPSTVNLADQIGRALLFLSSHNILHGGVRAENVVVSAANDSQFFQAVATGQQDFKPCIQVKLGDPGFVKTDDDKLIAWTPPELWEREIGNGRQRNRSHEGDVWAFGTFLWEVFSLCRTTPSGAVNANLKAYLKRYNLPPPSYPENKFKDLYERAYKLMEECWNKNKSSRPRMCVVYDAMSTFLFNHGVLKEFPDFFLNRTGPSAYQDRICDRREDDSLDINLFEIETLQGHRKLRILENSKEKLGNGCFGTVYRGVIVFENEEHGCDCAIKTFNINMSTEGISQEMLMALRIPANDNVVKIIGVMGLEKPDIEKRIVMELLGGGSLESYLKQVKKNGSWDEEVSLDILKQINNGMKHLHSNGILHRDLAVRNIMLTSKVSPIVAKVGDFGLSRETELYYKRGDNENHPAIPEYMYPPETLKGSAKKFCFEGDVWSFGMLLWDVFNLDLDVKIRKIWLNLGGIDGVLKGNVLPKPRGCSELFYKDVMCPCWCYQIEDRPVFYQRDTKPRTTVGTLIDSYKVNPIASG